MKQDTTEEKLNNPFSLYQVSDGILYFRKFGNLYRKGDDEKCIVKNVSSFVVYQDKIFYSKAIEWTLHQCDLEGENDIELYKDVDVCTVERKGDSDFILNPYTHKESIK